MATVAYIRETKQHLSAMRAVMQYCMRLDKTFDSISGQRLVTGIRCDGYNSVLEFQATKAAHRKMDGINFYQYVQSFSPMEEITPEQAHQVAKEFAQQAWPGHEVLVATHSDTDHIHSHFVINSVSYLSGRKLRQDPNTLKELRTLSDRICQSYGFSVLKPYKGGGEKISTREYRSAARAESWKFKLMYDIEVAMRHSGSREEFVEQMENKGYQVTWTEERKHITFTCPNGMKCRGSRLHYDRYTKENFENEFVIRQTGENPSGIITGWERERKLFLAPKFKSKVYPGVAAGLAAAGQLFEDDSEDPEQRRARIQAEENASNLGAILGVTIGTLMALTQEEQEIQNQEEYNEYYIREEAPWQQSM